MTEPTDNSTLYSRTRPEPRIQKFLNSSWPVARLRKKAGSLLAEEDILRLVQASTPEDQERFVEKVDELYPTLDARCVKLLTVLGEICSVVNRIPTSTVISEGLAEVQTVPVASGGLTDIRLGEHDNGQVAIKAFRLCSDPDTKEVKKILWKRVVIWKRLSHPNIARFRGVNTITEPFRLALVYDWAEDGNILRYTASHPDVSRSALLLQVAKGLQYLHSFGVPHGNLKGANVLVDAFGCVRLTDYGFAPINFSVHLTAAEPAGGNVRWLAPEIIKPAHDATVMIMESESADVFAFPMLAIEVFTGERPFERQGNPGAARGIVEGSRPTLPENAEEVGLTPQVWEFLQKCWDEDPTKRPTIDKVVKKWESLTNTRSTKPLWRKLLPGLGRSRD